MASFAQDGMSIACHSDRTESGIEILLGHAGYLACLISQGTALAIAMNDAGNPEHQTLSIATYHYDIVLSRQLEEVDGVNMILRRYADVPPAAGLRDVEAIYAALEDKEQGAIVAIVTSALVKWLHVQNIGGMAASLVRRNSIVTAAANDAYEKLFSLHCLMGDYTQAGGLRALQDVVGAMILAIDGEAGGRRAS